MFFETKKKIFFSKDVKIGWVFVEQPNGLFARFSITCNDFSHFNLSSEEVHKVANRYFDENVSEQIIDHSCGEFPHISWEGALGLIRSQSKLDYQEALLNYERSHGILI